jgi:hypothetical protein
LVVMVSSRASSSILRRAPALDQPRAQSSLRISSTMAQPWSSPRHRVVKENLSMNEVLNAQARF